MDLMLLLMREAGSVHTQPSGNSGFNIFVTKCGKNEGRDSLPTSSLASVDGARGDENSRGA